MCGLEQRLDVVVHLRGGLASRSECAVFGPCKSTGRVEPLVRVIVVYEQRRPCLCSNVSDGDGGVIARLIVDLPGLPPQCRKRVGSKTPSKMTRPTRWIVYQNRYTGQKYIVETYVGEHWYEQ